MTDEELKLWLRAEILRAVDAKIATAIAAAISQVDVKIAEASLAASQRLVDAFIPQFAAANLGAACVGCAIVAALAESGAINPARAVTWPEWMAANLPSDVDPRVAKPPPIRSGPLAKCSVPWRCQGPQATDFGLYRTKHAYAATSARRGRTLE